MMERLGFIKALRARNPVIVAIELFNELPHILVEERERIASGPEFFKDCNQLVDYTNGYADWIHKETPGCRVVSMATYNILDSQENDDWGITDWFITKRLALETHVDCTAVHCYEAKQHSVKELAGALREWHKEYEKNHKVRKSIWVTECGMKDWAKHMAYYAQQTSLFVEHLEAEKIIFYRYNVVPDGALEKNVKPEHWEYALRDDHSGTKSPLYDFLTA